MGIRIRINYHSNPATEYDISPKHSAKFRIQRLVDLFSVRCSTLNPEKIIRFRDSNCPRRLHIPTTFLVGQCTDCSGRAARSLYVNRRHPFRND